jgi:hypothetical protein
MSDAPPDDGARIDCLMDAIDLIKANRREEARVLLRTLIHENGDFEDAWLWMSLAVESLDQSAVCLDNALRINPGNAAAADALYRLRSSEIAAAKGRARLRLWRDSALMGFWLVVMTLLGTFLCSFYSGLWYTVSGLMATTATP